MSGKRLDATNSRLMLRTLIQRATKPLRNTWERRSSVHSRAEDYADTLNFHRKNDAIVNAETTPPEDENVDFRCMWAVEYYTPSHVEHLIECLSKLKSKEDDLPGRISPGSWVRNTRQFSSGGSWLNLGRIRSDDDRRLWPMPYRTAQLPKSVDHARGTIYSVTPSLTCVVICFVFDDQVRTRLDYALRKPRRTFIRTLSSGYQPVTPYWQKSEDIHQVRDEYRNLAANWFRENLPGAFCSGLHEGRLPTYELVTLRKAEPFPDPMATDVFRADYLRILDLMSSTSVWRSTDTPGLKMSLGNFGIDSGYDVTFVAREDEIDNEQSLELYGGMPELPNYVDSEYSSAIALMAIEPLLDGYSKGLNEFRDSVEISIRRRSRHRPFLTLEKIVENSAYDVDVAAVSADILSHAEETYRFWQELTKFKPSYDWGNQDPLAKPFGFAVNNHAMRLRQADQALRDHLTQYGSLIAAMENVKTQRQVFCLTIFVAAVAVATFLATDLASASLAELLKIWRSVLGLIQDLFGR